METFLRITNQSILEGNIPRSGLYHSLSQEKTSHPALCRNAIPAHSIAHSSMYQIHVGSDLHWEKLGSLADQTGPHHGAWQLYDERQLRENDYLITRWLTNTRDDLANTRKSGDAWGPACRPKARTTNRHCTHVVQVLCRQMVSQFVIFTSQVTVSFKMPLTSYLNGKPPNMWPFLFLLKPDQEACEGLLPLEELRLSEQRELSQLHHHKELKRN